MDTETDERTAVAGDEPRVVFRPVLDADTGAVLGFEAVPAPGWPPA